MITAKEALEKTRNELSREDLEQKVKVEVAITKAIEQGSTKATVQFRINDRIAALLKEPPLSYEIRRDSHRSEESTTIDWARGGVPVLPEFTER